MPSSESSDYDQNSDATELSRTEVCDVHAIAKLEEDYRELLRASGNKLPFALYDWHLAWLKHLLNARSAVRDQPRFQVLRERSGRCVGIVPLIVSRRRLGVLRLTSVSVLGADPAVTEIRGALIVPGYEQRAARAMREALQHIPDWDWIQWAGPRAWLLALARDAPTTAQILQHSYELDLPNSWREFHAGLKRNIRESLRHCYNSLRRDGHSIRLQVATDPADVRAALDHFIRLHGLRASMKSSRTHPNHFATESSRQFLEDVCLRLAKRGALRIFQLVVDEAVVAVRIAFVVADSLYLYYSGYDPAWARYSVMTTTVAEAIKYAIDQRLQAVNLSTGTDVSKTRWGPRKIDHHMMYEHNRRFISRVGLSLYVVAQHSDSLSAWVAKRFAPLRPRWD